MADEIEGVWIKDLKVIPDERGRLMEIRRNDDGGFSEHEAYVINVPNEPYKRESPDEYRAAWDSPDIPYSWDIVFQ
jgi:dTDP-4-dehydrorhamnose 3,5-epimerase-like enzyme